MNKILLSLLAILFSVTAQGQYFKKGTNNLTLDFGLNSYPNVESNISFGIFNFKSKGDAASSFVGLQYERGITDWFGLGVRLASQTYLDSADVNNADAKSVDFGIVLNGHLLKSKKSDLFVSMVLGQSRLEIQDNRSDLEYNGNGGYVELGLGFRTKIVSRVYFETRIQSISYKAVGDYSNSIGQSREGTWDASGFKIALGIGVRL